MPKKNNSESLNTKRKTVKKISHNKKVKKTKKVEIKNILEFQHEGVQSFLWVKTGVFLGILLGFIAIDYNDYRDLIRFFIFVFIGFLIGRFKESFFDKHKVLFYVTLFLFFLGAVFPLYIPFLSNTTSDFEITKQQVLKKESQKKETKKNTSLNKLEFVSWNFPKSIPIRTRFLNRKDEYQHFPFMLKSSNFPLKIQMKNVENLKFHLYVGGNLISDFVQKEETFFVDVPLEFGENIILIEFLDSNNKKVWEKIKKIWRVEKIIALYGDSLTTGYPENRIMGKNIFIRSKTDSVHHGMKISKNELQIPTASKVDEAYEDNGLHITCSDFLTEKGKTILFLNEARNEETVLGNLRRFEEENFSGRLKNISEFISTDLNVDYVHIMLGMNEAREKHEISDFSLNDWKNDFETFIEKIQSQGISAQNIFISFPPSEIYDVSIFKSIMEEIIAEKSLKTGVDFTSLFQKYPDLMHTDKIHFSEKGKIEAGKILGKRFFEIIENK